jgi:NAD(P)H dehydrogenase (quinone)
VKCLVVVAHPLHESLCHTLATRAAKTLDAAGHEVAIQDLCGNGFSPALTVSERASYYGQRYDAAAIQAEVDQLLWAESLVLCFPTWWFGFPAVLKGWFDRVWAPGIAYDHARNLGAIEPRLHKLKKVLAVTSLGAPWWVDRLVMRQPLKRILKTAILGTCAPNCDLEMLSLYKAELLDNAQVEQFSARVTKTLARWC